MKDLKKFFSLISFQTLAILYLVTFLKGGHGMWKFTVPLVEVTPAESAEWIFYCKSFYNISDIIILNAGFC